MNKRMNKKEKRKGHCCSKKTKEREGKENEFKKKELRK